MPPTPSPVANPLGPPVLNNNLITVDLMLNQPSRITRMISDLTLQRFVADRIFASTGGVTGGALIFDEVTMNELYTTRDPERVAPGGEFPVLTDERLAPRVALVEKWGGKVFITDEARERNNTALFTNQVRKVSNTLVRQINTRAIETLEAAIAEHGQEFAGHDWRNVIIEGVAPTAPQARPSADFAMASLSAMQDELGITYNLWLINPQEWMNLVIIYGDKLEALLRAAGISLYASNRVTPGTAFVVAEQQVGEMRIEKPLGTETWREPETEKTWVQTSVRPLFAVTNPFAVLKVTGLAG